MTLAPIRVVVIDDTDDTRTLMWAFLSHELPRSVRVHAIPDTAYQTAVDWDEVAVAIVDLMMPVHHGLEVLGWIKDNHPTCYRIAWTAAAEAHEAQITREALANALITKPGLYELGELVRAAL